MNNDTDTQQSETQQFDEAFATLEDGKDADFDEFLEYINYLYQNVD